MDDLRLRLGEMVDLADLDVLDLARGRLIEQEALDLIDDHAAFG